MSSPPDEYVASQIERLRRRLLDLSVRNPLVNTRFSLRSNAHLRLVDELPDVLVSRLHQQGTMRLRALPALDEDPRDEATPRFEDAVTEARISDEEYRADLDAIDLEADDALDRERKTERAMRDRVRAELGMPPRAVKGAESLAQHARNNGIDPSYDLPQPREGQQAPQHLDDDLQTLLLPKDLERKAKGLMRKCQEWAQETGVNVLHVACGFLEWNEGSGGRDMLSPLVLLPAAMETKKSPQGLQFFVAGEGDDPETNVVLIEKLKLEQGIDLPAYAGGSLEAYFDKVTACAPKGRKWRVRRQAAVGAWPSASLTMYRDLDRARGFNANPVVSSLIGGADDGEPSPFGTEYDVDAPEIEQKVPAVVLDADSSQFSALVDIMNGQNLAIEGPPGSGKSQTIVNAIANALVANKKVLFVAEKAAALNVVRARLEALGLGEFLLPLVPGRSSKDAVLKSIRRRLDMPQTRTPLELRDTRRRRDERRARIADYLELITAAFAQTDQTVGSILTRAAATVDSLADLPSRFRRPEVSRPRDLSSGRIDDILREARAAVQAWEQAEAAGLAWSGAKVMGLDRLAAETLTEQAGEAAASATAAAEARAALKPFGLPVDLPGDDMALVGEVLGTAARAPAGSQETALRILAAGPATVEAGLAQTAQVQADMVRYADMLEQPEQRDWPDRLDALVQHCRSAGLKSPDVEVERTGIAEARGALNTAAILADQIDTLVSAMPEAARWKLGSLRLARTLAANAGQAAFLANPALAQPAAVMELRRAIEEGRRLVEERRQLEGEIAVDAFSVAQEVRALRADAMIAGAFGFLSGRRRRARKRLRELTRGAKFDRDRADNLLERLATHMAAERDFREVPAHATLFGWGFRGLKTDFDAYQALVDYLGAIDTRLVGPQNGALRSVLKSGQQDQIGLIPSSLEFDIWDQLTCDEVRGASKDWQEALEKRAAALETLPRLTPGLLPDAPRDVTEIAGLASAMRETLEQADRLAGASWAAAVQRDFDPFTADVTMLQSACALASSIAALGDTAAAVATLIGEGSAQSAADALALAVSAEEVLTHDMAGMEGDTGIDLTPLANPPDHAALIGRLMAMSEDVAGLIRRSEYNAARAGLQREGVAWVLDELVRLDGDLHRGVEVMEAVLRRALAAEVQTVHGPALSEFSGRRLDKLRAEFADLDREIVALSRNLARAEIHAASFPPQGITTGATSRLTEMGLLQRIASQIRPRVTPRDLVVRSGKALKELKPCWLMSPQAVANYLPKHDGLFDLIIVDEASQMTPENAVGALARANQAVIVGDANQLPPTSFFRRMVADGDDSEADGDGVVEESVLELANATFRPRRRLRWHYRSRHAELIRFCNEQIYSNDLVLFPSATEGTGARPVRLVSVEGVYRRGTNPPEAKAMVQAALTHMRKQRDRSLGLVVVNQAQRELLEEELDHAVSADPAAQRFIEHWSQQGDGLEALFIKNIENVQGDERDVIFIGTVYGPERPGGPVAQRFGPLAGTAGRRRLNVLLSRAKHEIVTFSSMRPADIVLDGNPGRAMLRGWLEFAATGVADRAGSDAGADSPFEADVARRIRDLGVEVALQVGAAGYFIDIGIRHPDWPHGWLLGVECDGATYHSARSARDRDRLRQQILEDRGWVLHRIWSTDWFSDPASEMSRLQTRIEERLEEVKQRAPELIKPLALEPSRSAPASAPPAVPTPAQPALPGMDRPTRDATRPAAQPRDEAERPPEADVGDRVRIRYLDGTEATLEVVISSDRHEPDAGVISDTSPLGQSVLGASQGDEIEVLVGAYLRRAVVVSVSSA